MSQFSKLLYSNKSLKALLIIKPNLRYINNKLPIFNRSLEIDEDVDLEKTATNVINKLHREALAPGIGDRSHAYRISPGEQGDSVEYNESNEELVNTPYFRPLTHDSHIPLKSLASAISNELSDTIEINNEASKVCSTEIEEESNVANELGSIVGKTRVINSGTGQVSVNDN